MMMSRLRTRIMMIKMRTLLRVKILTLMMMVMEYCCKNNVVATVAGCNIVINWGDPPLCNIVINREDPRPPIMYYVIYGQPLSSISKKSDCSKDFVNTVGLYKLDLALCPKQSEYVTSDYQEEV